MNIAHNTFGYGEEVLITCGRYIPWRNLACFLQFLDHVDSWWDLLGWESVRHKAATYTGQHKHRMNANFRASSGIRAQELSVWAGEDSRVEIQNIQTDREDIFCLSKPWKHVIIRSRPIGFSRWVRHWATQVQTHCPCQGTDSVLSGYHQPCAFLSFRLTSAVLVLLIPPPANQELGYRTSLHRTHLGLLSTVLQSLHKRSL